MKTYKGIMKDESLSKQQQKDLYDDILLSGVHSKDNIKTNINEFIKTFILEGQKINKYVELHIERYEKMHKKKVSSQERIEIIEKYLKKTVWGNDKMLPHIARVIATGDYVH